jgi:F-type H+-transporting ATPase subunit delta
MASTAADQRYARALLEQSPADRDHNAKTLRHLAQALGESAPLRQLLVDPRMKTERLTVLEAVVDKLGATQSLKSLLGVLDQNERLGILVGVAHAFARLADENADRTRGTVTTAAPLSDNEKKSIDAALTAKVGKQVTLEYKVDPSLIGGVVAKVQDLVWDGSVRTQLDRMRQALRQ